VPYTVAVAACCIRDPASCTLVATFEAAALAVLARWSMGMLVLALSPPLARWCVRVVAREVTWILESIGIGKIWVCSTLDVEEKREARPS
jgi:hypothetical protein